MPGQWPLHGALFEMGANPDEVMRLAQQPGYPSTLVYMINGDQRAVLEVILDAPLEIDNTAVGAGGLDASSPLGADTVYDLRVICNHRGDLIALLGSLSGQAPDMPANYQWASPVVGAMVTDSTADNHVLLNPTAGVFRYQDDQFVAMGISPMGVGAYVDMSAFLPWNVAKVFAHHESIHAAAGPYSMSIGPRDVSWSIIAYADNLGNLAGQTTIASSPLDFDAITGDPSTLLYIAWNNLPTYGTDIVLFGFRLKRV